MKIIASALSLGLLSALAIASASATEGSLVEKVRAANSRFQDVKTAVAEGYAPIPCASGIDGGAMGVHYVNGALSEGRDARHQTSAGGHV